MREVHPTALSLEPYEEVLGTERMSRLHTAAGRTSARLGGRRVWNVNSTAAGGGVAELLHTLVPLARAFGLDVRWLVVEGDPEFFAITKRLCTRLYGGAADSGALGPAELTHYQEVLGGNDVEDWCAPGDVVIIHEAQPAGLVTAARKRGATVIWRRHIGRDVPNEHTREGWAFLRPFVEQADLTVFLTARHVPDWAPRPQIVPPSIDPCSPKNIELSEAQVRAVLSRIGAIGGPAAPVTVTPPFGGPIVVDADATIVREGPPPPPEVPMVVQVSRWDELKDMAGVLDAFVAGGAEGYLTLAGADVSGVGDDPEAALIFEDCRRRWAALPDRARARCQLICLPMADLRANAVMVNALQRHASVIVQKSLAEGFGLTATEAMWKGRPLLASAVGGLAEQVVDGESGLLLPDPYDIGAAGAGIKRLLGERELAHRLGEGARARVSGRFLPDRHLLDWAQVIGHAGTLEVL